MKSIKWPLLTISFLAIVLNNFALAEGDGGGDSDGDYDGGGHHDGDGHHHHDHNHLILGIGGYYDPWFWGGYGYGYGYGYYNPGFWGNYYGPGFYSPYGYRTYGYVDPFFRPYNTYPPGITTPSRPPVYIQQQEPKLAQPKTSYWYYCQNPQGYYPHIKECPGGWTQVAPQPYAQ